MQLFLALVLAAVAAVATMADPSELESELANLEANGGGGEDADGFDGVEDDSLAGMDMEQMQAMMGGGGGGGRRFNRDIFPVPEDVPLIQCDVCKLVVKRLTARVADKRKKFTKTKITEEAILAMQQHLCEPMEENGEWIAEYDIVEEGDKLVLKRQPAMGNCEEECKTIAMACQNVLDEADSEIAELVYLGKPAEALCESVALKGRCGQVPPVPADRSAGGDNFKVKSAVDIAMAKVSRDMRREQDVLGSRAFDGELDAMKQRGKEDL